jgi:MFS family permease
VARVNLSWKKKLVEEQLGQVEPEREKLEGYARSKTIPLWRNWYIGSLLLAVGISFIGVGLVAPLRTLYARAQGASGGEVGMMAAAYLLSASLFLLPFGWLSDRYNRVVLIILGLVGHVIVTLGYLVATSGEWFIALRFLEGITAAAVLPAARAILADLVPEGRNGEAFGLMSAVMMFGLLAGPPVGTFLAEGVGYTAAYVLSGLIYVPGIVLVFFAFKNYRPAQRAATGVEPLHIETRHRLLSRPVVIGCLVRGALSLGPGLAIAIWSLYMADLGYDLIAIGWTYTIYSIPMVLVAPGAGRLSDRYGRLKLMFGGGIVVCVTWTLYGWVTSFWVIMALGVIEGSFDAIARSANDGYLADNTPPEMRGRAQGLFNAVTEGGSLIGALGAGFLYEIDRRAPFVILSSFEMGLMLLALALVLIGKARRKAPGQAEQTFITQMDAD